MYTSKKFWTVLQNRLDKIKILTKHVLSYIIVFYTFVLTFFQSVIQNKEQTILPSLAIHLIILLQNLCIRLKHMFI